MISRRRFLGLAAAVVGVAAVPSPARRLAASILGLDSRTPIGTIVLGSDWRYYVRTDAGWLAADGRTLDAEAFPALFRTIGTVYGGTADVERGVGPFVLPDLRARAVR